MNDKHYEELYLSAQKAVNRLVDNNARLRSALEKYGEHIYPCENLVDGKCSCGLHAALRGGSDGEQV